MRTQISIFLISILVLTHDLSVEASKACSDKCGTPAGTGWCQSDGKCLCWWGWTGGNAAYVKSGQGKGRIKADHCQWPCNHSPDYQNPECTDEDVGNCTDGGSDSESDEEDV